MRSVVKRNRRAAQAQIVKSGAYGYGLANVRRIRVGRQAVRDIDKLCNCEIWAIKPENEQAGQEPYTSFHSAPPRETRCAA